jgi:hypothetical protein
MRSTAKDVTQQALNPPEVLELVRRQRPVTHALTDGCIGPVLWGRKPSWHAGVMGWKNNRRLARGKFLDSPERRECGLRIIGHAVRSARRFSSEYVASPAKK